MLAACQRSNHVLAPLFFFPPELNNIPSTAAPFSLEIRRSSRGVILSMFPKTLVSRS